jgi:hypothetical protein
VTDRISRALEHRLRRRLIEAMWHNSHPLTAERFHEEFVSDKHVTLAMVVYHARQLNRDGIVESTGMRCTLNGAPLSSAARTAPRR